MANTPNYEIDYNDKRFTEVESDKKAALEENENTYGGMVSNSDKYYQEQINAAKDWADKQTELQNQQTDFAIEKIEQEKDQAKKDYTKEQSGAYVDWQKQSNQYGANAEQVAAGGLVNTGFAESSQVSMYNTYQSRITAARESYQRAVLNYNNAIKDARLQNSSVLAEIAYQSLQKQLELSLAGFQYKNQLLIEQANKKLQIEESYYNRYQDVLDQINKENSLAEQIRQFNQEMEYKNASLAEEKRQFDILHPQNTGSSGGIINKPSSSSGSGGSSSSGSGKTKRSHGGSRGTFGKSSSTFDKSSNATVDTKSVLALGYGPISGDYLASKVASGEVKATEKDGKITFKKSIANPLKVGFKWK